jgi:YbbR domain-containing protein
MSRMQDRLLGLFTRNVWWKLAALALAVLLWVTTVGEQELVTTHAVPILYKGLNPDFLIGSDAVDQVRVELRGPASKLQPSSLTDLAILIDLSAASAGTPTFTLAGTDLHLPPGVAFLRAVPSQLRVPIARKVSKDVPVQIQIGAAPPAGYHVAGMDASPAVVRIAGPEPRVGPIASAQTEAIDLSHAISTTEVHVNVFLADPRVGLESDPVVTVRINIEKDKTN